ncbi:MAG: 5-formyltetrahydrofolate cyclo-ligase [Clostridia bacterium]|nr:5-formyltetrahydrofolate cyclo-ligase [Clostridia bacterium]
MTVTEQKKAMRVTLRAQCKALPAPLREALSRAACERLVGLSLFADAACILAYKAMPHECDPQGLVDLAIRLGKRVAFPVCGDDYTLRLLLPSAPDAFVKGKYGIWEPDPARSETIQSEALDLIVLPGVAFDAACNRLGQGAGYYDRLLTGARARKVGVAFPVQIVPAVPMDVHDIPLDAVVTADTVFSR